MTEQSSEIDSNEENPSDQPSKVDSLEGYQKVAEAVGMVPSLRWKDNLIQAVVVIRHGRDQNARWLACLEPLGLPMITVIQD